MKLLQEGGKMRRTRKTSTWATEAGKYYRAHKNDSDINSFSDVLKSKKFKAHYNKMKKGGGGEGEGEEMPVNNEMREKNEMTGGGEDDEDVMNDVNDNGNEKITGGKKRRAKKSKTVKKSKTAKKSKKSKRYFGLF